MAKKAVKKFSNSREVRPPPSPPGVGWARRASWASLACDQLPSGNDCYSLLLKMAHLEIVDLPIQNGWIFP